MSGLNFANFKKTAQDKKSATLVHPDGHEITIAIAGISPAMRKKLAALPLHQAEPEGEVEAIEPAEKEAAAVDAAAVPQAPEGVQPNVLTPMTGAPPIAAAPAQAPVAEAPMADNGGGGGGDTPAEETPQQESARKTQEDLKFGEDLRNNKIQPKTYSDLFHSKDTLGKIGTIFGLILSGAGAGLTHSKNSLLEAWDQQIKNDMEAQKTDESNRQNWRKLQIEHDKTQAENALTYGIAGKTGAETDYLRWKNQDAGVTNMSSEVAATNKARLASVWDKYSRIQRMPEGPLKTQALNDIEGEILPFFAKKIADDNASLSGKTATIRAANGANYTKSNPPPRTDADPHVAYDAVNNNKFNEVLRSGAHNPQKLRGFSAEKLGEQKDNLEVIRAVRQKAVQDFEALAGLDLAGQAPGVTAAGGITGKAIGSLLGMVGGFAGATAGGAIGSAIGGSGGDTLKKVFERRRETAISSLKSELKRTGMAKDELDDFVEGIMPSWNDSEGTRKAAFEALESHFNSSPAEKASGLKAIGVYHDAPKYNYDKIITGARKKVDAIKPQPSTGATQPAVGVSGGY